ncbi:LamB/YcsF family protein [Sporosarcina sp. FA9]|uniref:LamB/YcsF family protein n=1 Tax=Sporosarcina sp. FA9 TaxID=3413030 RepID=UPI003F655D8B
MRIDINADVGESYGPYIIGEDELLFPFITSANIACGFHAGDFNVIAYTIKKAVDHKLAIGAHPGYPDLQGFGRRNLDMTSREIYNAVVYQIGALQQFCIINNVPLAHVKPHGALYNTAAVKRDVAVAIAEAVYDTAPDAYLFGLSNSELIRAGEEIGLKTAREAFADRRYDENGFLCSRLLPKSVLQTQEEIEKQVLSIILNEEVQTSSGGIIQLQADTICFHGDGNEVSKRVESLRNLLRIKNIMVKVIGEGN